MHDGVFRSARTRSIPRFFLGTLTACADPESDIAIVACWHAFTKMWNKSTRHLGVTMKPRDRIQQRIARRLEHRLALVANSSEVVGILPSIFSEVLLPGATFRSLDSHLSADLDQGTPPSAAVAQGPGRHPKARKTRGTNGQTKLLQKGMSR